MSESSRTANLGCGTLILVALIVLIFGNKNDDLVREIQGLRTEVQQLSEEVRNLKSDEIKPVAEAPEQGAVD